MTDNRDIAVTAAPICTCCGEASKRWPGQHAVTCPQRDPEQDERLRADLAAIREAERRALNPESDHYLRARIAEGRIRAALALLDHFDPTCGAARTRTFVADLHHILDGAR